MLKYWSNKVLQGVITLFILALVVFIASRVTGDPLALLAPSEARGTQLEREELEERLGLHGSPVEQFGRFVGSVAQGDLGQSYSYRQPVWDLFKNRFPNTLKLVVPALLLAIAVSVPLGVISARRRGGMLDRVIKGASVLGVSVPNFWLGIVLVLIFAVQLRWLPASRMGGPLHYVLPVVTLSTFVTGGMVRLIRSSMLEELGRDYVKLARTKGVLERTVTWRHALRNSLLPVVAFGGTYASLMISGSVAIEAVFAWPGVGKLLFDAVTARDYPLAQGLILITGLLIIVINLLTDVVLMWLDPRIR
jgi:peptide/nickel transport system permease protein